MLIELACYNQDSTFDDILEATFIASQKGLKSVAIPSGFMPKVNGFLKDQKFSAAIDFPYGLSSTQVRVHEIILAIRQGASYIDLVINAGYIKEASWKEIKDDLKCCTAVCEQHKILLRPIIEYRLFPSKTVMNLCESLNRLGIEHIINSTGFVADDISENLLFSYEVQTKTGVAVTSCLKGIHKKHLIALKELDIYGLRLMSPKIAESIL
jgi:deoxyribose-phosphate aldolase|tara:strand:+ start:637 stop:1269 length:633 start_codon:yes stop_codon:yes gene_type:complete